MARVIQLHINTPLADEVLFGRLKNGGTVRVMVTTTDEGEKKLGFVYPEGPVLPRPERDIVEAGKKRVRSEPEVRRAKARKAGDDSPEEPEDEGSEDEIAEEAEPLSASTRCYDATLADALQTFHHLRRMAGTTASAAPRTGYLQR